MNTINIALRDKIKKQLIRHEAIKLKLYQCTAGKTTIGVGRNLSDRGISPDEAMYLLDNDISAINRQLTEKLPFIKDITDNRKQVLLNMAFNLGIYGLLKFRRMLNAMDCADYVEAGQQMLDSRWAEQVGDRAVELAHMMIEG